PVPVVAPARTTAAAPAGLPAWVDPAMLAEFYDGQLHGLTEVEEMMLDAASLGEAGRNKLARILHTLKGESATVGFAGLEELYHALEDRLLAAPSPVEVVDDALALKDWVLRAVPALITGESAPPGREELLERLRATEAPAPPPVPLPIPTAAKNVLPSDPEAIAMFGEFFDEAAESLIQADELLVSIEAGGVEASSVDALFRTFHTLKGLAGFLELGSIQALAHAVEALLDDARNDPSTLSAARLDLILRATNMVRSALHATREAVAAGSGDLVVPGFDALLQKVLEARRRASVAPPPVRFAAPVAAPSASSEEREDDEERKPNLAVVRETIKVDLTRVDSLVETIGELVIVEAMVNNAADLRSQIGHRTRHQLAQLSKIVRDLQRQGLALRMVPLRGVFQKMSRLVRDLSRRSGKSIQLELSGQDAEMDRSLAERLGDPLVHMMRNAADHGIEPSDQRVAAGKPPMATIRLSAYHEGGNIIIELSDDGRGLNRDAIVKKAIERGLIDPSIQLSDPEAWELIFAPASPPPPP
ncbi:MAG: Hpt domain-containing protein, partial [Myxococcota bacterium]